MGWNTYSVWYAKWLYSRVIPREKWSTNRVPKSLFSNFPGIHLNLKYCGISILCMTSRSPQQLGARPVCCGILAHAQAPLLHRYRRPSESSRMCALPAFTQASPQYIRAQTPMVFVTGIPAAHSTTFQPMWHAQACQFERKRVITTRVLWTAKLKEETTRLGVSVIAD